MNFFGRLKWVDVSHTVKIGAILWAVVVGIFSFGGVYTAQRLRDQQDVDTLTKTVLTVQQNTTDITEMKGQINSLQEDRKGWTEWRKQITDQANHLENTTDTTANDVTWIRQILESRNK